MQFRAALVSVALAASASLAAPAHAATPANSFTLVSAAGKTIGSAAYTISKDKNGYRIVGKFQFHLGSSVGTNTNYGDTRTMVTYNEGEFTEDFKVSEEGNFISGYTQNSSNQMMTSFLPNKAGTVVTINQIQGGVNIGSHDIIMPKAGFLVVPDFDPATLQVFLTTALAHPHDDKTYLFLAPAGSDPKGKENALYVTLQLAPETLSGILDGKTIKVLHYLVRFHTSKADFYADETGNLMQADMGALNISLIRAKFALTPAAPAK